MSTPVLCAISVVCGLTGAWIAYQMILMGTPVPVGAAFALLFAGFSTAYLTEHVDEETR